MERVILKNKNNEVIELSEVSLYTLIKIEGLGSIDTNIYSTKSTNQDGVNYQGNTLEYRAIHIELAIVADSKEDMIRRRSNLLRAINPKSGELELTYINGSVEKKIEGILETSSFPYQENFADNMQPGLLDIYCSNPYLRDIKEMREDVSVEVGGFEFPLNIPVGGLELSKRIISFITNIYNYGDVETPIRISLQAIGTVENPIFTNLDTGEYIKVNRILSKGDKLEIDTQFGNKTVVIIREDGSKENVFNYIDYKSRFFSIGIGDTRLEYGADLGENNLDVYIYYTPKFLGV